MGVMIGSPTGVACSVCPGGTTSGNPVNPLLGPRYCPAKLILLCPASAVCAVPLLQQLPDENARTGALSRLESPFRYPRTGA
jgi:hypothetical protein